MNKDVVEALEKALDAGYWDEEGREFIYAVVPGLISELRNAEAKLETDNEIIHHKTIKTLVLADERDRLKACLEVYANPENWIEDTDPTFSPPLPYLVKNVFCPDPPYNEIVYREGEDGGAPARFALSVAPKDNTLSE